MVYKLHPLKLAVVFIAAASFMLLASFLASQVVVPVHQKWLEYNENKNTKRHAKAPERVDEVQYLINKLNQLYREQKLP